MHLLTITRFALYRMDSPLATTLTRCPFTRNPLHPLVFICVQPSQPVIGSVLWINDVQHTLDKIVLILGQHVSQVSTLEKQSEVV